MKDTIKIALTSLLAKKGRSALSILGIVIGILTVSSLLTLSIGVRRGISSGINDLGANLIAVVPGQVGGHGGLNIGSQFGASTLTESDYESIKKEIPSALNVSIGMPVAGTIKAGETSAASAIIFATSPGIEKVMNLEIEKGRFINSEDNKKQRRVVVLGANIARTFFGDGEAINKTVSVRGETFKVIGILKQRDNPLNFGGPDLNDLVEVPIETAWGIVGVKQIFRIMMQAPSAEDVGAIKEKVFETVLKNHNGEEDFSVLTQSDILSVTDGVLDILTSMLTAVAAISLLVGGIGIMNIMLVAVSERTREIGIRKAVGATRGGIVLQFLIESVILTLLAGIVAVIIFIILVNAVSDRIPIPIEADLSVILLALLFSVIVGIIFGLLPATNASRKDPVQALRYE